MEGGRGSDRIDTAIDQSRKETAKGVAIGFPNRFSSKETDT